MSIYEYLYKKYLDSYMCQFLIALQYELCLVDRQQLNTCLLKSGGKWLI